MAIRKLPVGIQSFEKLRRENYVYIDKTQYIRELLRQGSVYFLSRPRRFGKSLLISTMEAYFRGKKDLFRGLAIEEYENAKGDDAWQEYPVIHFALSSGAFNAENGLSDTLNGIIDGCIEEYGLKGTYKVFGETLPVRFRYLIERLYAKTGKPVVVLVDEYDKPLLETMEINAEQEVKNRLLYKGFFSVLKDEDQYLKFVFFTGVTKFSKVSIFSDLNQLNDISLDEDVSCICGITEQELQDTFGPEVSALAASQRLTEPECLKRLAEEYDGYHFSAHAPGVYNPFSLLNSLSKKNFGRYWFATGTPTFLINKLQNSRITVEQITDGVESTEDDLGDYRAENKNPIPLFYQSGYLTLCGFDREFRIYSLRFPNNEVKYGFLNSLIPSVLGEEDAEHPLSVRNIVLDLRSGKIESVMNRLQALFASVPYAAASPEGTRAKSYEWAWRDQIFLIFALLGQNVKSEVHSAAGRADCIVETKDYVYIFEFKLDKTAEEALAQIEEKGYADPYKADLRKVLRIGVNFSTEKRNIAEWKRG